MSRALLGTFSLLLAGLTNAQACTWCEQPSRFELGYLETYFPKALVSVEEYFTDMCPDAIATALGSMVELLGQRTYYYFKNNPDEFAVGEYFENILQQCKIVGEYLDRASVDKETGRVQVQKSVFIVDPYAAKNRQPLLSCMHENGRTEQFDFYAFTFDYNLKMFNEGIRFCLLSQAYHYSTEIERLVEKLRGSSYEAPYQEVVKRSKDLISLLRSRLGIQELQGTNGKMH